MPSLYFIESPSLNMIKIGASTNPKRRLHYMLTHSPSPDLRLLYVAEGESQMEHVAHAMWAHSRSHGEWFRGTRELRKWIALGCPWPNERSKAEKQSANGRCTTSLGQQIKAARKATRQSQRAAARKLEVSMTTWSRWETNRATPSIGQLQRIAELLGTNVSLLTKGV